MNDVPISVKFSRTTYKQLIVLDWTNYNIQFIQFRLKKEYNPNMSIVVICLAVAVVVIPVVFRSVSQPTFHLFLRPKLLTSLIGHGTEEI